MSASEFLRKEHQEIMRLEKLVTKCSKSLYDGKDIPFSHIDKINFLISEFLSYIVVLIPYFLASRMLSKGPARPEPTIVAFLIIN